MSNYNEELAYINEVFNLLEVSNFLPPKILERAKNRVQINNLKKSIEQEKNIEYKETIQENLKECLDKEIKYQKLFSKFNKEKFIVKLLRKIRGKL